MKPLLRWGHRSAAAPWAARRALLALAVVALAALWLGMLHSPEPNWDEGWTLTLARTWVERGFYGQLTLGEPRDPGLGASFVTVAPVAASFKLLGVGFWQGRLAIALLVLASLGALALLARSLYGPVAGAAAVPVLLLTTIHATANPLYFGRQAMGEPAMLLSLAMAFLALVPALGGSWRWGLVAVFCGGLALSAKAQTAPFWTLALVAPLPLLLWRRRWATAGALVAVLVGSFVASRLMFAAWSLAMAGRMLPIEALPGLTRTLALVLTPTSRRLALEFSALVGVPALLGMAWAGWGALRSLGRADWGQPREVTRLALLAFAGSWYAWYLLLSVGWSRYLYPVVFLGAVFAAAMLAEWTGGFSPRETLARLKSGGAPGRAALVAVALLAVSVPATLFHLAYTYPLSSDRPLLATAGWLNSSTAPGAIIETNESELFVYLQRPYHSPPDALHVVANQRLILGEAVELAYDPLAADPDYLVTGRMDAWWQLYRPAIEAGHFRPVQRYGIYTIYERVRPEGR